MHRLDDFLLDSELAKELYHEIKDLPIVDFHTNLSARELVKNDPITDIGELWLKRDYYKWRLMRNSGILEFQVTGEDNYLNKFKAYAKSLERAYLNPLHHWSHLELKHYFHIDDILTSDNAEEVYNAANTYLKANPMGPKDILEQSNVEAIYIDQDLNDDLEDHKLIKDDSSISFDVLPIFTADSILDINSDRFLKVIEMLEKNTSTTISGITTLATALSKRLDYFNVNGCKVANHNLSEVMYFPVTKSEASKILKHRLTTSKVPPKQEHQLRLYLLKFFLKEYAIRDMVCQFHIGAIHNTNERMHQKPNDDKGYDSISTHSFVDELNQLLGEIHSHYPLPNLVIYHLNPMDNEAVASVCGNFSCEHPGKVQFGGAWWFNNHEYGITKQLLTYANYLNLSTYVGMASNAIVSTSMVRHDYFRRILANTIADQVNKRRIPSNKKQLLRLVKDIAYTNRKLYFIE